MAFKEARKSDSLRFSSARETLDALSEKRRNAPAREAFSDEAPLPQYDPSEEAGFDAATGAYDAESDDSGAPTLTFDKAFAALPADLVRFVRERFHAEFSRIRAPRNVFSYRGFGEDTTESDEAPEEDSDDA